MTEPLQLPPPPPPEGAIHRRARTSGVARAAVVALVAALPVSVWWLVGANPGNEIGNDAHQHPDDYDYLIRAPELEPSVERALGIVAILAVAVSLVVLIRASRAARFDRRWWPPLCALLIAGVIVGAGVRIVTAAVVGANIGGGMVILFGTPVVVTLGVGSAYWAFHLRRIPPIGDESRATA